MDGVGSPPSSSSSSSAAPSSLLLNFSPPSSPPSSSVLFSTPSYPSSFSGYTNSTSFPSSFPSSSSSSSAFPNEDELLSPRCPVTPRTGEVPVPQTVSARIVKLNVGGRKFITRYSTLMGNALITADVKVSCPKDNFFVSLLSGRFPIETDEKGYIFIDRNGEYFESVLDYLRVGKLVCPAHLNKQRLLEEAHFYGLQLELGTEDAEAGPLSDRTLSQLIHEHTVSNLERNYDENREGLRLVEKCIFKGFRVLSHSGKEPVVRFWPAIEVILTRCRQKWGSDLSIHTLPIFMTHDPSHMFDNNLYEVCKKGRLGLAWHLKKEYNLTVITSDTSDYLTTHSYVSGGSRIINSHAWCVVSTEITPHVYHAAEAVSVQWFLPPEEERELLNLVSGNASHWANRSVSSSSSSRSVRRLA